MKSLYIAVEAIYPINTGSRIRAYQLVKALSQKHEVGLAYISADRMESVGDLHCRYIEQIKLPTPLSELSSSQKAVLLLKALVQNSFPMTKFYLGDQQVARVLRLINDQEPELVVLQSSYILPLAKVIRRYHPNIKIVLDAHNIESLLQTRMATTASSVLMKPIKKYVAGNLAQIEKRASSYVSGIAAVSKEEAEWFKQFNPTTEVTIIPNGVDVDFFKSQNNLPKKPVIAFCGSMSYLPNHTGAAWFAQNVWPLIIEKLPEAQWLIIGKDPPQNVQELAADSRITVTGTVDDVREWMDKSRLSVVPLLSGGGTRLKILEAMAMERVIVSTTLGAEGIAESPGVMRVDGPKEMAATIVNLLDSNDLPKLGKQNRKIAVEQYSWKAIGLDMVSLVERCNNHAASGS